MARFWFQPGLAAGILALGLAACVGSGTVAPQRQTAQPAQPTQPAAATGGTIGNGSVRVALILPLTANGPGAVAAQSLRNAAEL